MKLIIADSRDITDYEIVRQAVIESGVWKIHKTNLEIVSGMARGVDMLAVEFAKRNGLQLHKFPADWNQYGKSAGHIRNKAMAEFAHGLVAVWDGQSKGTQDMIRIANERSMFVYVKNLSEHA